MERTKPIIVVYSYHHMNTEKIAHAMADVLGAEVRYPREIERKLNEYNFVGFGAGIDSGKHYAPLLDFVGGLPYTKGGKAFIFSTSGVMSKKKMLRNHETLREILRSKGYDILDEFACKGFNTNSVLKFIGGINKGSPNDEDINAAREFAAVLKKLI
ncbi:MAG TPA: flavodoxin [Ruminococcaceae bacterium]|nr:flavodoxin [Oscillospiraceae bacterium]